MNEEIERVLSFSHRMNGMLDDDYTLYESGKILHEFDKHQYPGGQNLTEELSTNEVNESVKLRLLQAASDLDKNQVKQLLGLV